MTPEEHQQQKKAAREFVAYWQKEAKGSEKAQSREFWIDLFTNVLGVTNATRGVLKFEFPVQGKYIDVFHEDVGVLIEHKSRGVDLDEPERRGNEKNGAPRLVTPYEQAKWYADNLPHFQRPRWLVLCNFDEIRIHDLNKLNPAADYETLRLEELPDQLHRLSFLTRKENSRQEREKQLSVAVCEPVGRLYDELAKSYQHLHNNQHEQQSLNILLTRIVFLLYAEDADLLHEHGGFTTYLRDYKAGQTAAALRDLFDVLKTPTEQRDPYLSDALKRFPYTNGGLFEQPIIIPQFSEAARAILLEAASFDWKDISPTIFGAVFESTLNPVTRRAGGMHYTSIENIHKVIDPLFLDALEDELDEIAGQRNKSAKTRFEWSAGLAAYRQKLASLRIFDPACGSGNFLTETYLRLRELENRALQHIHGEQLAIGEFDPIQVSIKQFYGVEINDFAVEVAKTALWIAELQMLAQTRQILANAPFEPLPLKDNANIHCANALRIDWNKVLPAEQCSYIIGNPPFVGQKQRSPQQKQDIIDVWSTKNIGLLDYVSCWYRVATKYLAKEANGRFAFVSTNSICQGEPVPLLFKPLFNEGWKILFAHQSFKWTAEIADTANLHVIIIGMGKENLVNPPSLYKYTQGADSYSAVPAQNINGYLLDAPSVFIEKRRAPLGGVLPKVVRGPQATDNGHLIIEPDAYERAMADPIARKYVRRFKNGNELINNTKRWCLWLVDAPQSDINESPFLRERVEACRQYREAQGGLSSSDAYKLRNTPHLFRPSPWIPDRRYLAIPTVFSERRLYATCDWLDADIIPGVHVFIAPDEDGFAFAIAESTPFITWQKAVGGRTEMRCNFSNTVVWNNFPVPEFGQEARKKIIDAGKMVFDARAAHPGATLAQLYDPDKMPANLREAHHALDAAVEAAYGVNFNGDEERITAHLFQLYAAATQRAR